MCQSLWRLKPARVMMGDMDPVWTVIALGGAAASCFLGGAALGAAIGLRRLRTEMRAEQRETRHVVQHLVDVIDADQRWFWAPEWQDGEREAELDLATGNYKTFDTAEDFAGYLEEHSHHTALGAKS